MENYSNIKKSIDWASEFESQLLPGETWDDIAYAQWLLGHVNKDTVYLDKKITKAIPMLVVFIYKYAVFYSRKILKNSVIYSLDDFSFLASLLPNKHLKKSEVIRKNISEKSSGNEVIKRLLRQNLILETNNPDDKRSKLLQLSALGLQELNAVRLQFETMGQIVTGDLNDFEKSTLFDILIKLHQFHNPLFITNDEKMLAQQLGIPK